jgi:hypothetical protein
MYKSILLIIIFASFSICNSFHGVYKTDMLKHKNCTDFSECKKITFLLWAVCSLLHIEHHAWRICTIAGGFMQRGVSFFCQDDS